LKFEVDSSDLREALESVMVKGKGTTNGGFGNTNLGTYACLYVKDGVLSVWNGSPSFCVKIDIQLEGESVDGDVCVDSMKVIPYLKSFGGVVDFNVGDFITITTEPHGTNRTASIPLVVLHPNADAISRLKNMLNHIRYEVQPQTLFNFGKSKFEGAFVLTQPQFKETIKNCELVKSGVYKLDFNENVLTVSTRQDATNKYEEVITPVFPLGEPPTVEFSSPVYAFFKSDQMVNVYMKDDHPLLLVSNDRMLLKAPHISG